MTVRNYFHLLIILIASLSVFTSCGKQVKGQGKFSNKFSLMISPLINKTGNKNLDHYAVGLSEELARRFEEADLFTVIEPKEIFKKIELTQLLGNEVEEQRLLNVLVNLKPYYGAVGSINTAADGKTLILRVKVIRCSDNALIALETVEGKPEQWSRLRGKIAVRLAKRMRIPLTNRDIALLKKIETGNQKAFRLNYIGKMYYYRSLEAKYKNLARESQRNKNIAMAFWARSVEQDAGYEVPKYNYSNVMDAGDVRSSTDKKIEKAQGNLNGMTMFGFVYKSSRVWNPSAWVRANALGLRAMIRSLPKGFIVEVQGHTDSSGPEEPTEDKPGNIAISKKRAKGVYDAMLNIGIPRSKIRYKGYGSSRTIRWLNPKDPSNRRVTFEVRPKLD